MSAAGEAQAVPAADAGLRRLTGYLMKRAFAAIQSDLRQVLAPLGLTMTGFSALVVICDRPGISQTGLAAALAMERSNVAVLVEAIEAAGLIGRDEVPDNRRTNALRPTPAGRRLRDLAMAAVEAHEARQFAGLSAAERRALHAGLERLVPPGATGDGRGGGTAAWRDDGGRPAGEGGRRSRGAGEGPRDGRRRGQAASGAARGPGRRQHPAQLGLADGTGFAPDRRLAGPLGGRPRPTGCFWPNVRAAAGGRKPMPECASRSAPLPRHCWSAVWGRSGRC